MNETYVTFQGWMGTDVELREAGGAEVATFRVASTPRKFNRTQNTWADGETTWYTVNAWRALGRNCAASLGKGDAVCVHGRQAVQVYENSDGVQVQSLVVEATFIGPDLTKGTARFEKVTSSSAGDDQALKEANAQYGVGGPQVTSDGENLDDMVRRDSEPGESAA